MQRCCGIVHASHAPPHHGARVQHGRHLNGAARRRRWLHSGSVHRERRQHCDVEPCDMHGPCGVNMHCQRAQRRIAKPKPRRPVGSARQDARCPVHAHHVGGCGRQTGEEQPRDVDGRAVRDGACRPGAVLKPRGRDHPRGLEARSTLVVRRQHGRAGTRHPQGAQQGVGD